jgi:hypothetical protein
MATTPLQQQLQRAALTQTMRVAGPAILAILLILVVMVGIFAVQPWYISQDLQGSVVRQAVGKVTGLYYQHKQPVHTVTLEVNGVRAPVQTTTPVRIGQPVQVTYRVGKSGRMYVVDMAVLTGN